MKEHSLFPMEKYIGEWKDNKRWNVVRHDKDGNIIEKLVNGEEQ